MPKETSKQLAWFAVIFSGLISSGCLVALCFGINTVPFLAVFMPYPLASLGFYSWKAKGENELKIERNPMYKGQEDNVDPNDITEG